jgi:type III secretion protein Q
MTYPLDEPTTEDEAATDPHAARERAAAVESAHRSSDVARSATQQHGAAAMSIATIVKPAHDVVVIDTPVKPITPLRLPSIGRAAARVTRTVRDARVARHLHATFGITEWHATLADAHSLDSAYADPGVIELTLTSADGISTVAMRVALDLHAYPALSIAAWPDSDALTAKPPADVALRQAVAGVVLEPLFEQLIRAGCKGPRVAAVRRGRLTEADPDVPVIALSFVLDEYRYQAALSADPACYDLFDRLLRTEPAPASVSSRAAAASTDSTDSTDSSASSDRTPETAFDLTVPGSLILGVKRLPVDTLHALEPGDVLLRAAFPSLDATLLGASSAPSSPHARPRAVAAWGTPGLTRVCAAVELDGQSLVIVKEPNMSEELDPASADAGLAIDDPADPIRIGELELPVQFEIDTVALPLAQLSALGPGYVLELPVPVADAQLRLVAHGQTIGYGELVTVGEHLGIRIIRMAHRHGPIQ